MEDRIKNLKKEWKDLRKNSPVFEQRERTIQLTSNGRQKDEWGFCISEILPHNSILFLGLNPSAPPDHVHESFEGAQLMGSDFKFQRQIASEIGLNFAYWDVFPVRMTAHKEMIEKFDVITRLEAGRSILRHMFDLTRLALETARPKAVYVCNGYLKDTIIGTRQGYLAKFLREANLLPLSHSRSRERHLSVPVKGKRNFFYNTMNLHGALIPVLLGNYLGDGRDLGPQQAAHAVKILKKALADPEGYMNCSI